DGCYPPPRQLAKAIHHFNKKLKVRVVAGPHSVHRQGIVYILRRGTNCNRVRMAWLSPRGLYILDSTTRNVRVYGQHGPRTSPGQSGPPSQVRIVSRSFALHGHDDTQRLDTICPRGTFPLGGGMTVNLPPGTGGEGVYPHSYERLG